MDLGIDCKLMDKIIHTYRYCLMIPGEFTVEYFAI